MSKKIISLLLTASVIFTLCSCGPEGEQAQTRPTEGYTLPTKVIDADFSFPYTSAESFDPYESKSNLNRDLISVIFESLYVPTNNGLGQAFLASSESTEGLVTTVKLKSGLKFSDGTTLDSSHVKSSFERAKNSPYYSSTLSNVSSVSVVDSLTVQFNFSAVAPFTLNTLIFPVVKGTGNACLGSGKYSVQYLDDEMYLGVNTNHREYSSSWNKQVALYDMAGKTGPVYHFKANEISVYKNDLISEKYVNLSSETVSEDLNNLVYIGINTKWAGTVASIDYVRHAINLGIDRNEIATTTFLGQNTPVVTFYKPAFCNSLGVDILPEVKGNKQKAVEILERNGYTQINEDGVRTNGSASLKLDILVCTANEYRLPVAQAVKKSLEELGFGITITEKATVEEFTAALQEGHFGLYIGETNLSYDYGLEEFFKSDGALSYGINEEFYPEYAAFENGTIGAKSFIEVFETYVPFVPLYYRKSVTSVNPLIQGLDEGNLYASVYQWKLSE